ncbi:MAG TPA: patatin-like phospholipase family protein [Elusimicrobiota bacterium]|nr:patatin-like phospholipase family protein [Elusimicrobiota bacterium]
MTRLLLLVLALAAAVNAAAAPDLSADALLRDHLWREVRAAPVGRRPKVGLVLSAGSLRAAAHVGVIKVLENAGFPIDVVAGTSMGAVVGSLYAGGLTVDQLWNIAETVKLNSGNNLSGRHLISLFLFDKLLSSENTELEIRKWLHGMRFDQTKKPFACVSMDVYTGEAIIFHDGDLAPAVRASMNLPGIFQPLEYRHRYLVDGGVVDYIPVDAARLLGAQWTIASITENDYTAVRPKTVLDSLEQVIDIRGSYLSREQRKQANYLIEPPVGDIGMFEEKRIPEAMEKGVIAASKRLDGAEESLILASIPLLVQDWRPELAAGAAK